ncbi:hypothetical protein, partial [Lonepinella sp. BR2271]|uniref:hypothetical protein n=1 Tax=Lonepinella sp. BR2271 TaxID=3434550 RepID=UPI003F6E1388
ATVKAKDDAGNDAEQTIEIKVQRDSDGDGKPDVSDDDNDNDGIKNDDDKNPLVKDTEKPVITAEGATVTEKSPIEPIAVTVVDNDDKTPTVTVEGLPDGLTYANGQITGTPTAITDWKAGEQERTITATVKAKDDAGNDAEQTIEIKVQRDSDGDGKPDVSDDDNDNDGIKNDDDKNPLVKDTEKPVITAEGATVTEKSPIEPIAVTVVDNDDKTPTVTVEGLPDGLTYANGQITGTPTAITDWGTDETVRTVKAKVIATDDAGNTAEQTIEIKVQRDIPLTAPDVQGTDADVKDGSVKVVLPTLAAEGDKATIVVKYPTEDGNTTDVTLTSTYTNGAWGTLTSNETVKATLTGNTVTIPAESVRDLSTVTATTTRGSEVKTDSDTAADLDPVFPEITVGNDGAVKVTYPTSGMEIGDKMKIVGDNPASSEDVVYNLTYKADGWTIDGRPSADTDPGVNFPASPNAYRDVKATVTEADGTETTKEYKATLTAPVATAVTEATETDELGSVKVALPTTGVNGDTVVITVPYPTKDGKYVDVNVTFTYGNDTWTQTSVAAKDTTDTTDYSSLVKLTTAGTNGTSGITVTVPANMARDGKDVVTESFRDGTSAGKSTATAVETVPELPEFKVADNGEVSMDYPSKGVENGDTIYIVADNPNNQPGNNDFIRTRIYNNGQWELVKAQSNADDNVPDGDPDTGGNSYQRGYNIDVYLDNITDTSDTTKEIWNSTAGATKKTISYNTEDHYTTPLHFDPVDPELRALKDGSVLIYMPPEMKKVVVTYTDEQGVAKEVTLTAKGDGTWTSSDSSAISVQEGGYATLHANSVKDGSQVKAQSESLSGELSEIVEKTAANDPSYFSESNLSQSAYVGATNANGDFAYPTGYNDNGRPTNDMYAIYKSWGGTANQQKEATGTNNKFTYATYNSEKVMQMWTDANGTAKDAYILRGDLGDVNGAGRGMFINMNYQKGADTNSDALIIEGQIKGLSGTPTRSSYDVTKTSGHNAAVGVDTGAGDDLVWVGASNSETKVYYRAEDGTYHLTEVEGSTEYTGNLANTVASSDSTSNQGGNIISSEIILGAGNDHLIVEGWTYGGIAGKQAIANGFITYDQQYDYDYESYAAIYNSLVDVGGGLNHIVANGTDKHTQIRTYNNEIISSWITDRGEDGQTTIIAQGIRNSHISLTGGGDDTISFEYGEYNGGNKSDFDIYDSTGNVIDLGRGLDTLILTGNDVYTLSKISSTAMSAETIQMTGSGAKLVVSLSDLLNENGTVALDPEIGQDKKSVLRLVDQGSNNTVDLEDGKFTKTDKVIVDQDDAKYDVYTVSGHDNLLVYVEQSFTVI